MLTPPSRTDGPGRLAANSSAMPSSGWMRRISQLGVIRSTRVPRNSAKGA